MSKKAVSMIEKVARAIYAATAGAWCGETWEETGQGQRDNAMAEARAAIEAMREPTPEMIEAGAVHGTWSDRCDAFEGAHEEAAKEVWQIMLSAALKGDE
jgi:hypothetical protein